MRLCWLGLVIFSGCLGTASLMGEVPPAGHDDAGADAGGLAQTGADAGVDAGAPDAGAPDAGGAPPYDAGSTEPCGALEARVHTVSVSVAPAAVDPGSSYGWSNNRPIHFAPMTQGRARVAWTSTDGKVHVTPLDASLARAGADVVVDGASVRGFVVHDDGAMALLVVRGTQMVLVRLRADGTTEVEKVLVGDEPSETVAGARWVDGWGHEGRLLWTGSAYVAYFGHTKYWGAMGKHQGDILMTLTPSGDAAGGASWDWGCSHSLDVRLAWDGARVAPVCLSDCYRAKGVLLDDSTVLVDEPSGNCAGSSDGQLGGLAPLAGGGFALTFSSREGRGSRDVGFIKLDASGTKAPTVWLTTAAGDEASPTLARYATGKLLATWRDAGGGKLAVLSADGAVLEGPVSLAAAWGERDDLATWDSGHVGWATGAGSSLEVTQVRACR